ncbi:MAG TPA: hypothetical protein PKC44_04270, partial [Agitococcus sp.]|nr:hypothetical protein [Agitococcus sp.]
MNLADLFVKSGIRNALIVDDVYDAVPTASDIGSSNDSWTIFNDDLSQHQKTIINKAYPIAAHKSFNECIEDDEYIAAIWSL